MPIDKILTGRAIRHWSAEGGHPIEDLTAKDDLNSPAQLDSGREGHLR